MLSTVALCSLLHLATAQVIWSIESPDTIAPDGDEWSIMDTDQSLADQESETFSLDEFDHSESAGMSEVEWVVATEKDEEHFELWNPHDFNHQNEEKWEIGDRHKQELEEEMQKQEDSTSEEDPTTTDNLQDAD